MKFADLLLQFLMDILLNDIRKKLIKKCNKIDEKRKKRTCVPQIKRTEERPNPLESSVFFAA
jgi:hypothetical protein